MPYLKKEDYDKLMQFANPDPLVIVDIAVKVRDVQTALTDLVKGDIDEPVVMQLCANVIDGKTMRLLNISNGQEVRQLACPEFTKFVLERDLEQAAKAQG